MLVLYLYQSSEFIAGGDEIMSKKKPDRKKERMKLYKKVRNTSSWRSTVIYLLLILLFIAMMIFLSGFVVEYIFESKFKEGYNDAERTAKLYEKGQTDSSYLKVLESEDSDFFVKDDNGKIIYQKGKNTCSDEGGELEISNGKYSYCVYCDKEIDIARINKDGSFSLNPAEFLKWYTSFEDSARLPLWVSFDLEGGKKLLCKAYLSFSSLDRILVIELLAGLAIIVFVFCLLTVIKIIKSAINFRRVVRLFYSDPVTNGHNWMWYVRYGEEKLRGGRCKKYSFAVVDLVFRNYRNYCLCHSISEGEELLSSMNRLLCSEMNKKEMCAHAAMSNFALLLIYDSEEQLRQRLNGFIEKLKDIDSEHSFHIQIGVDLIPPKTDAGGRIVKRRDISIENAYNNACTASATLADSEESGLRIFDSNLLEQQKWENTVQEKQQSALDNDEFVVYYQPKYDPCTDTLKGAEALIRWESPEYGLLTPYKFIPIFEKNGFITQIDHYMISHVARAQKKWLDEGKKCVPISVNVSRVHFAEPDLAEQIRDLVDKEGAPHELIEIELTESAFFDDKNAMLRTIAALKEYGFDISMDDFGSGYSSLNSLKDMPLDVLKLDAEFFRGDNAGERGRIVVSEAIKLARSLNMRTVAEGVEIKEQVEFLAQQHCDMIQGYYYAKPMPAQEFEQRIQPEQ